MKLKKFFFSERFFLFSIFLFVFLEWLTLANIEKITHPDYYMYYSASAKLFSGNLKLQFIPPFFPFLLGLFGRLLNLFASKTDSFILAGRIIALFSGLGVVYSSFRLLKKITGKYAPLGVLLLVISPYYLKMLSIPQTDMLYLFFTSATFYFLLQEHSRLNLIWAVSGGLLTRFEGVLLIGSTFINFFKTREKRWLYSILALIPVSLLTYFLSLKFAPRIIEKIHYVIGEGHYLYFFKHPGELAHLFYGNFLFFIPTRFPSLLKWTLLFVLLACFVTGYYYLFKMKRRFAIALLFYQFVFVIFKGYTFALDPEVEFRRMLSVIWIFFILAFAGIYFILARLEKSANKKWEKISLPARIILYAFLFVPVLFRPVIKGSALLVYLILLPAVLYGISRFPFKKIETIAIFFILAIFCGQAFFISSTKAYRYVTQHSDEGGYMTAQWLNSKQVEGNVLVYSHLPMVQYYLDKASETRILHFVFKDEKIYHDKERLKLALLKRAQRNNVKYILFDNFLNPEEGDFRVVIYKMLYEEKEKLYRKAPGAEESYFQLLHTMIYKGKPVVWVLKPLFDRLPKKN